MNPTDFNNQFYSFGSEVNEYDRARVRKIVEMCGQNHRVLDIGCMDGVLASLIKAAGNTVYGIDISEAAVERAIARGIQAKVGNIENRTEFEDSFFDVVVAGEVIEHLYDTDLFLEEIHRLLKPSGYMVLTTPNIATLSRRLKFFFGKDPGLEYSVRDKCSVGHIRFFMKKTLRSLIEKNQFTIQDFRTDFFQFGGIKSAKLGDFFPSLGKRFIVKAQPIKP